MTFTYDNRIINQDCISGMSAIESNSADIIIADPPYNIGKDFGNNSDRNTLPAYISWSISWITESMRILKDSGTLFIYGFPEILAHLSVNLPLDKQRWLQWHYTNKNMPRLNFWQRSHESIICAWKGKPIFNRDDIREPYTQSFLAGSAGRIRPATECRLAKKGSKPTVYHAHEKGALPRDVLNVSTLAGGAALKERNIYCKTCKRLIAPRARKAHRNHELIIHPTQKPLELTEKLICSCKPQNGFNILIPFCGSGSECKSALQLGGNFLSFEINPEYVILAKAVIGGLNLCGTQATRSVADKSNFTHSLKNLGAVQFNC